MPVASRSSRVSLAVLAVAATAAPPVLPVAAQPETRAVTPEACGRLGYDIGRDAERDYGAQRMRAPGRGHAPQIGGYAAAPSVPLQESVVTAHKRIPDSPSIPPLPVPPVEHRIAPPPGPPPGV